MINNLKLEFKEVMHDYLNGVPYRTRVVLGNEDGVVYPVFFPIEDITKPEADLFAEALEVVYEKNFYAKAENEKFAKYEKAIAATNEATVKVLSLAADFEHRVDETLESLNATGSTVMSFVELFYTKGLISDEEFNQLIGNHSDDGDSTE